MGTCARFVLHSVVVETSRGPFCSSSQKVLLALAVAAVVGLSETVLFILWQSRSPKPPRRVGRSRSSVAQRKKTDGESATVPGQSPGEENTVDATGTDRGDADVRQRRTTRLLKGEE